MTAELHIQLHPEAEDPEDVTADFPFEPGQTVLTQSRALIIIDLDGEDDTTPVQDWYLNEHDEVFSFYVVGDEPVEPDQPEGDGGG